MSKQTEPDHINLHTLRARLLDLSPEDKAHAHGRALADRAIAEMTESGFLLPAVYGGETRKDGSVSGLKLIAETVGIKPKVVYNPGSNLDASISQAFPDARSIFLDKEPEVVRDLQKVGLEAYEGDMATFRLPDDIKADVVFIKNAGFMTQEQLDEVVADEGLVVVNNWHGAADYMSESCPDYSLIDAGVSGASGFNVYGVAPLDDTNTLYGFQRTAPTN